MIGLCHAVSTKQMCLWLFMNSYKWRQLIYIWNGYFNFCEGGSNVSVFLRIVLQQCGTAVAKQLNLKAL